MTETTWSIGVPKVAVARRVNAGVAVLRVRPASEPATAEAAAAMGIELPPAPNTRAGSDPAILWLAPGEWMLRSGTRRFDTEAPPAVAGATLHLADVTDGRVSYAVTGPLAGELLAKGCTIDFHPRVFAVDACVQSALAQVFVIIERGAPDGFLVHADASLAHHLDQWFEDALPEFRLKDVHL